MTIHLKRSVLTIAMTTLLTLSCGEDQMASFEEIDSNNAQNGEGTALMSEEEISDCLDSGGSITKKNDVMQCVKNANSADGEAAQAAVPCKVEELSEGAMISCEGSEPVLVRHGIGCSATEVEGGFQIICGASEPMLVRHGNDGKDGEMCQVKATDNGALVSCGDDYPVAINHGKHGDKGDDGVGCTVTETETGAIVTCGEGQTMVAIRHGEKGLDGEDGEDGQDGEPFKTAIVSTVDPCGPHNGFDEILLKMNDGRYVAYFEHGSKRRFLTILDPATQAGKYRTTDKQACQFTLGSDGYITW